MKKILILSLFLTSCTTLLDRYEPAYNLYGCDEKPHDKSLHYGDFICVRVGTFKTKEECEKNLSKAAKYDTAFCKDVYIIK